MGHKHRLRELWEDPKHWTKLGIYRCKEDPRLVVPKRIPFTGWTLNMAHRKAYVVLLLTMAGAAAPTFVALSLGVRSTEALLAVVLGSIAGVCLLCFSLSRPKDREE